LGHALGHTVVAEGIEDDSMLRGLEEAGCDQAQGYAISPPLAPEECYAWLKGRDRQPTAMAVAQHGLL
jgi:EAL domain-containing protein (putative c-di-GMP-specific phosphodiesterase class I)